MPDVLDRKILVGGTHHERTRVGPIVMHRLLGTAKEREEQETWVTPEWSGVPVTVGNLMIVPLHVGDMRNLKMPDDWQHKGFYIAEDGEVEYHVYRA